MRKAKGLNLISILLIVSLAVMSLTAVFPYVYSYFTATAREQGDLTFGSIGLNMLDEYGDLLSSETFQENYLYGIDPGSTLDLNGIEIENSGENDAYVLVNVDVEISNGTTKLNYNKWYNVDGMEVNVNSFAANVAEATLIGKASSATANIAWTFPGDVLDNTYQNANAKVSVGAYGMQTLMPKEKEFYVGSDALFASYFICKNATEIQADNAGKNLFNINNPLMLLKHQYDSGYAHKIENGVIYSGGVTGSSSGQIIAVPTNGEKVFTFSGDANTSNYKAQYYGFYNYDTDTMMAESPVSLGAYTVNKTITLTEDYNYVGVAFFATEQYAAEISNFQIELGSTATEYEPYDSTIHAEITSTPLMTVGGVSDTASNTQIIVRNVKKVVLTGDENWDTISQCYRIRLEDIRSVNSSSEVGCVSSTHYKSTTYDMVYSGSIGIAVRLASASGIAIGLGEKTTDLNAWKAYLKSEYEAGHPVTIWYELATPTTEKVIGSKNLYDGDQFIHYQTGASDNNTLLAYAHYDITDEATVKILRDKQFVVSAKYKNYEDDTTLCNATAEGFIIAIKYTHNTKGEHIEYITTIPTAGLEDKWVYAWANNQRLLDYYTENELSGITAISIQFRAYSNNGSMIHYDMKNVQIELGSSPTDFEVHDQTVYAYVKGVPLMQVGSVKDTYDAATGNVTREIKQYVVTGNENWYLNTNGNYYQVNLGLGADASLRSLSESNVYPYSQNTAVDDIFWIDSSGAGLRIKDASFADANALTSYLKTQYNNGNPLIIWYVMA